MLGTRGDTTMENVSPRRASQRMKILTIMTTSVLPVSNISLETMASEMYSRYTISSPCGRVSNVTTENPPPRTAVETSVSALPLRHGFYLLTRRLEESVQDTKFGREARYFAVAKGCKLKGPPHDAI